MIPKAIIEKAIEGGWEDTRPKIEPTDEHNAHFGGILTDVCTNTLWWPRIALDKTFWQALGKVLGWGLVRECPECRHYWNHEEDLKCPQDGEGTVLINVNPRASKQEAHRFYDLILAGGDTEKFWNDLLA